MSLFFMQYFEAFYKNINLYSYNDEYQTLSKILNTYSKDKLTEYSENTRYSTFSTNKIKKNKSFYFLFYLILIFQLYHCFI